MKKVIAQETVLSGFVPDTWGEGHGKSAMQHAETPALVFVPGFLSPTWYA
jgi:hypothetical protein